MFIEHQNKHITMIIEGSCDTNDWSNNAENSVLYHCNILLFKIENSYFPFLYFTVLLYKNQS